MTRSRKRSTTRRRSQRETRAKRVDDELEPIGEPQHIDEIDPIDELEPWEDADDEGPVHVSHDPASGDDYDQQLTVEVANMEKSDVCDAVAGPLRTAVRRSAAALRWQRVYVEFTGDAMIPTAVKQLVADIVAEARPRSVTVQRGYPDEQVYEAEPPAARVEQNGGQVSVDTTGVEPEDLTFALRPELDKLAATASGQSLEFSFSGDAAPDDEARELIRATMASAGAVRVAVDGDAILDRELEKCVTVRPDGAKAAVTVTPAGDEEATVRALQLVLRRCPQHIAHHEVHVELAGRPASPDEINALLGLAAELEPARLELASATAGAGADVLWPELLQTTTDGRATRIAVEPNDRDRTALLAALRREIGGIGATVSGHAVTVKWPAGTTVDTELERACVDDGLVPHAPGSVVFEIDDQREPIFPAPLRLRDEDDERICEINTDTGKPVELVRALEHRMAAARAELAGRRVRVEIAGSGAVSRTMRRTVFDQLEAAGVDRAELRDRGNVDVLLPRLAKVEESGPHELRITADPAGRTAEQLAAAVERELEGLDASAATVLVTSSEADATITAALVASGAERVVIEGERPLQVHPRLFAPAERSGDELRLQATPSADDAVTEAQLDAELAPILSEQGELAGVGVTLVWPGATDPGAPPLSRAIAAIVAAGPEVLLLDRAEGKPKQVFPEVVRVPVVALGKRDDATPPISMLGIAWTEDDLEIQETAQALQALGELIDGRRVLVVFRDEDGADLSPRDDKPLVEAIRGVLDGSAAAVMLYRKARRGTPAHFEVVHTRLDSPAVGAQLKDPRR